MNSLQVLLIAWGLSGPVSAPPQLSGDLILIANPSVAVGEISADDLKSIFLGTTTSLKNSGSVRPVLDRDGDNFDRFAIAYLGKSGMALETYYRSLVFTGRWSMPAAFGSDAEVVDYVAKTRGAISFVRGVGPHPQVRILKVK